MGAVREWERGHLPGGFSGRPVTGIGAERRNGTDGKACARGVCPLRAGHALEKPGDADRLAFPIEGQVQENTQLQSTVENQMETAARASIENLVAAELSRMDIKSEKVVVWMDTNADNSIGINRVEVTLAEEYGGDCAPERKRICGRRLGWKWR